MLHSLERNFHGVTKAEFEEIATTFFTAMEKVNGADDVYEKARARLAATRFRSVVDVLREALADNKSDCNRCRRRWTAWCPRT